jgi:hypothetical protein
MGRSLPYDQATTGAVRTNVAACGRAEAARRYQVITF